MASKIKYTQFSRKKVGHPFHGVEEEKKSFITDKMF